MSDQSLFPPYEENRNYGMFGYQGFCCDSGIFADRVDMVKECIERGFMNETTRNFYHETIVVMAERRGKDKVAKYLRSLGWR